MNATYMELWHTAWANIQEDFKNGAISYHQFLKEREYMRAARIQLESEDA